LADGAVEDPIKKIAAQAESTVPAATRLLIVASLMTLARLHAYPPFTTTLEYKVRQLR
jgi:hypothetical protein